MTRDADVRAGSVRGPQGTSKSDRRLLSVIAPCYNESETVGLFYRALVPVLETLDGLAIELILVDDGSTDDTLDQLNAIAAQDPRARVYSLSRNFGHQVALTAGLDAATGDAVIMMDSDLQHPPALIPELVGKWRGGHDIVSAIRRSNADETWFKGVTSRGFYLLLNALSATKVPPGAADYCLLSRRVVNALARMPERHRFLRGLVSWVGFNRVLIPYEAPKRARGRTKYGPLKMLNFALDAVFSFSAEPLRLALRVGLGIVVLGFIYLASTLIRGYLLNALVPGYSSIIGIVMILGGSQLAFIGLLGQYLARVFEEVKGRPIYLLKQEPPQTPHASLTPTGEG